MPEAAESRYWTSDRIMHLIIGLAVTFLLIVLIRYLSDVLLPFFVACFVAYLLQPLVELNRRLIRSKGRALASILTIIDVTVVIGLVVYLFLPSVISELDSLGAIIKSVTSGQRQLPQFYRTAVDFIARYFDPHNLIKMLDGSRLQSLMSGGASILEESIGILMNVLSFLLTLVYILFILIDYPQIVRGFKLIVPHRFRQRVMGVVYDVEDSMNHYFRGQGLVALCAMVFYCIGFSLVGLPLAIPMGIIVGILYMIPYFQYVTVIPGVCDYIITPHIMGKEMGLNPAVILLSLSVWGSLLGIIGMIIALPVTAIIMAYYERYISEPAPVSADDKEKKHIL